MSEKPKAFIIGETGTVGRGAHNAMRDEYDLIAGTEKQADLTRDEGFRYFNFLQPDSVEKTLKSGNFDVILDLAGIANSSQASNPLAWQINCYGVLQMLDIISHMPIRRRPKVVLPLSVLQFDIKQSGVVNINHPLKPTGSEYVMQKNTLFHEAQKYLPDIDIYFAFIANTTGIAHPLGYFGPDIMKQLVDDQSVIAHGDVDQSRPFLDSRDAGRILACAIRNTGSGGRLAVGESFFLASGASYNMREFFEVMKRVANKPNAQLSLENDAKFGPPASIKEIRFNIDMLTSMGYKEQGNMQTIAEALLWEAQRVKDGRPLPVRGLPDELR